MWENNIIVLTYLGENVADIWDNALVDLSIFINNIKNGCLTKTKFN